MPTCRPVAVAQAETRKDLNRGAMFWLLPVAIASCALATAVWGEGHEEVIVTHAYSNFGEPKYPADFPHLDYVNPDAPKGGEFSTASVGAFDSFNIWTRKGVASFTVSALYESMLTATADDAYGTYCYMCTTMEYPESRDWVIFNMREDVTFSDGSGVTAEDIKFSYDFYIEQGLPEGAAVYDAAIKDVEILDTYRIKFTFEEDAPRRDVIGLAGGLTIFSKDWFEADETRRLDDSTIEPFLGTGPYIVESFDIGRRVVLGRNPNYWGADLPFNIGTSNFDTRRTEYFADGTAAFEGFKAGVYTFRNENMSKSWGTAYTFPAVEDGYVKKVEYPDGTIGSAQAFIFNLDRPVWQDAKLRAAMGMMFNFEWSNETLFYNLYERVNSFWENSDLEARGVPTPEEVAILQPLVDEGLLDAAILTDEARMAPTSGTRPLDRRNLRAASALLDEAGWEVGDDGIRVKDGKRLTADFLSFSPAFDRIINPYVENLRRLGVDAKLDRVDVSQYIERRRSGDFDLTTHSFSMGFEPGSGLRAWYSSESADDSSRNLMRLRDPSVDRLLPVIEQAETLEELTTAVHALDRVLRTTGFWVPQWFKNKHTVAYFDIYKHPDTLPPFALGEMTFWWYDPDAHQRLRDAGVLN